MPQNNNLDGINYNSNSNNLTDTLQNIPATSMSEPDVQNNLGDPNIDSEEKPSVISRLSYYIVLILLLATLIGLPIWVLMNQEERGSVAGISENKEQPNANISNSLDTKSNSNSPQSVDDTVYIYDPDRQTFNKKNQNKEDTQSSYTQGGGSINLNPSSPVNGATFAEAFAQARSQLGSGAVFEWNGQIYSTDYSTDENTSIQDLYPSNIYKELNPSEQFVDDNTGKVLKINECNLNIKYPLATENGAMVDFDRMDFADNISPYWTFYAFSGYRTEVEKFGIGYTFFVQCFNLADLGESYSTTNQTGDSVDPEKLYEKTGWFIADDSIQNLHMSRNENLVNGYSITFTRGGQLYSMNFMTKPKDSQDTIGGLYAYQIQLQFQN